MIEKVVKRNGKKVNFDGNKIAIAIKKGFDSVEANYGVDDVNKVYNKVIIQIEKCEKESIKIEQIQDLIEQELQKNGYNDVYNSFKEYRERRAKSRATFSDEKRLHKFLKIIEKLVLKANTDENNANSSMIKFGSTLSKEFSKIYLIKKAYSDAHDEGDIYIHDIEFMPMGTTQSVVIDLKRIYKNKEIDLLELEELVVKLGNEQHGKQIIKQIDTALVSMVVGIFKNCFKHNIEEILDYSEFNKFIAMSAIEREIEKIASIQIDITIFDKYTRESECLKRLFEVAYKHSLSRTEEILSKEMQSFINHINKKCYINFGEENSPEGKMINRMLETITSSVGVHKPEYILSTTTINLPRIGLKYIGKDFKDFLKELDEKLELVKDQLLERFEIQCSKTARKFPTLIMQGVWEDGEKLDKESKLRRVLKQGSFIIRIYRNRRVCQSFSK